MREIVQTLGQVSIVPRGEYSGLETYKRLNAVSYNGGSFLALRDGLTGVEPVDGEDWMQLAAKGDTGPTGAQGPRGETGAEGPTGPAGPTGLQGETGEPGAKGDQGPKGDAGDVWVPSVDPAGQLTWEKNREGTPEGVNIKGPAGDTGPKGDAGDVWVPSYDAETGDLSWAKNGGTDPQPVNIRGPKGEPGERGPAGPQGPAGSGTGDMLADTYDPEHKAQDIFKYTDEAVKNVSAENVKFTDGQTFQQKLEAGELKGDRGETGPAGPAGPQGADGEPGKNGEDGQPGKDGAAGAPGKDGAAAGFGTPTAEVDDTSGTPSVEVTAEGADTEKVFHFKFTGLKGAKGDTGSPGADGAPGTNGTNGKDGSPGAVGPAGPNKVSTETATDINGLIKGNGSTVLAAVAGTDYAKPPFFRTVSLEAKAEAQTVTVTGVSANEEDQLLIPAPKIASMTEYMNCGVKIVNQGANTVTFAADSAPSSALTVYVVVIPLK